MLLFFTNGFRTGLNAFEDDIELIDLTVKKKKVNDVSNVSNERKVFSCVLGGKFVYNTREMPHI